MREAGRLWPAFVLQTDMRGAGLPSELLKTCTTAEIQRRVEYASRRLAFESRGTDAAGLGVPGHDLDGCLYSENLLISATPREARHEAR